MKNIVIRSINNFENNLCVDIFQRKNNTYGCEEYRREIETFNKWYKIGFYDHIEFSSRDEAFKFAYKNILWLKNLEK